LLIGFQFDVEFENRAKSNNVLPLFGPYPKFLGEIEVATVHVIVLKRYPINSVSFVAFVVPEI